jgi:uncharacterized repeat protein (TIGR03803 family)
MKGNSLYGTTPLGGVNLTNTVYEVSKRKGTEAVLWSFCTDASCADGYYPLGKLVMDKSGNLYGTTEYGGAAGDSNNGTVFQVTPAGESVLYSFTGFSDGGSPAAGLLLKSSAAGTSLYGTTQLGGSSSAGTVFEIFGGSETVLHSFVSGDACAAPKASLIMYRGNFYGTSTGPGQASGCVFKLGTAGGTAR